MVCAILSWFCTMHGMFVIEPSLYYVRPGCILAVCIELDAHPFEEEYMQVPS